MFPLSRRSYMAAMAALTLAALVWLPASAHAEDFSRPEVTFTSGPDTNVPHAVGSNVVTFTANEDATFSCAFNARAFVGPLSYTPCTSPVTVTGSARDADQRTISGVVVRAEDAAGNVGFGEYVWTTDEQAPQLQISSGTTVTNFQDKGLTLNITAFMDRAGEQVTVKLLLDGKEITAKNEQPGRNDLVHLNYQPRDLALGKHTLVVTATDGFGNATTGSYSWTTLAGTAGTQPGSFIGNNLHDKFTGDARANTILGNGGNDTLNGAGGDDRIHGGPGNDKLIGGPGRQDGLFGEAGNDVLDGNDRAGGDIIDGGPGTDTCYYNKGDRVRNCEKKILKK